MKRETKKALNWILSILKKYDSTYQITGGLAAIAHGAKRELVDIDIEVPHSTFQHIISEVRPYIFWGPARYQDKNWDLFYAKLEYAGQKIDICDGDSLKIVDDKGKYILNGIDFSESETKEVFGVEVSVMPKEKLIRYKSVLGRDVDKRDIEELESQ